MGESSRGLLELCRRCHRGRHGAIVGITDAKLSCAVSTPGLKSASWSEGDCVKAIDIECAESGERGNFYRRGLARLRGESSRAELAGFVCAPHPYRTIRGDGHADRISREDSGDDRQVW